MKRGLLAAGMVCALALPALADDVGVDAGPVAAVLESASTLKGPRTDGEQDRH